MITAIHAAIFSFHYAGRMMFPWDFIGGYHAHAAAWYADGWFFDPPQWISWGGAGFPAYWALQSGAFYLPMQGLDLLNIPYTIENAVRLQALHVLLGALGAMALSRAMGFSTNLALLAAVGYHFSVGFYSNQQHVDIIRAAAILPWLIWAFLPANIIQSRWRPFLSTLILFQFLVAAYPGNIVAAVYTMVVVMMVYLVVWQTGLPKKWNVGILRLGAIVFLVVLAGVLMSMVKWLPPLVAGDWSPSRNGVMMAPRCILTTLIYPYDVAFLPLDLTMRSLWLPLPLVIGALYIRRLDIAAVLGLALVGLALLLAFSPPNFNGFTVPGLRVSRFPVSDWRPTLHIGLLLAACAGWRDRIAEGRPAVWRDAVVFGAFGILIAAGLQQGFTLNIATVISFFFAACAVSAHFGRLKSNNSVATALIFIAGVQGAIYHLAQGRPWMQPWGAGSAAAILGAGHDAIGSFDDRTSLALDRRPARLAIGETHAEIIANELSSYYNSCFYEGVFCLLGYNNLKMSAPHQAMLEAVRDPMGGPAVVDFLSRPQALAAFPPGAAVSLDTLEWDGPQDALAWQQAPHVLAGQADVRIEILGYQETGTSYLVSTPAPINFVENEIWTSNWSARLCPPTGEACKIVPVNPTHGYLRSWTVPPGTWRVEVDFHVPAVAWAWWAFAFGWVIAAGASWFATVSTRHSAKPERVRLPLKRPT